MSWPLETLNTKEHVVTTSCLISQRTDGTGNMVSRLSLQLAHGCSVCAGLATPRESPSRELGTRFGGLMAYSYTRQRLSTSEEVLGRSLGKGELAEEHTTVPVYDHSPLGTRA